RERRPGRERAGIASAHEAERDADLARRRPRQELAERHDVGIDAVVQPFAAADELLPKISDMRDRTAEGGEAEAYEGLQDLEHRSLDCGLRRLRRAFLLFRCHGAPAPLLQPR